MHAKPHSSFVRPGLTPRAGVALGVAVALVASLALGAPRCTPRMARDLMVAAMVTTAVVAIARHDAHQHHLGCGHEVVYVDGRDAYYYGGHWEYYDEQTGQWYRYVDDPAPPPAPEPPPPPAPAEDGWYYYDE